MSVATSFVHYLTTLSKILRIELMVEMLPQNRSILLASHSH